MTEAEIIEKYSMSQTEALQIIRREADALGYPMLETLQFMQKHLREYDSVERCAFGVVFRGFQQLFAPKEAV